MMYVKYVMHAVPAYRAYCILNQAETMAFTDFPYGRGHFDIVFKAMPVLSTI
jgi:hypothetical protein